ncbi:hypothetical protein J5Y04_05270 [Kitasatospora sp. RG8]|uniref:hypothetical protein n=1 Tax=Kitasatospora sp. RG8 TaxID=2820815 RepID=UPI001ADF884B|nr:hypothetical protein [Kitasatospora sp. RG8]MBP0448954.1 hypothetical protein [Kitasatospora sp. RG8]
MLLTYIAEIADEPLLLEPDDRHQETEINTWWLSTGDEDRRSLSVPEVVAAFERTADALRARIHASGYAGPATFYVWHDEQAGQLRLSTGSVPRTRLPFGGAHVPTDDLGPVVAAFLADDLPGIVLMDDLEPCDPDAPEPELPPFPVWVRDVGTGTP